MDWLVLLAPLVAVRICNIIFNNVLELTSCVDAQQFFIIPLLKIRLDFVVTGRDLLQIVERSSIILRLKLIFKVWLVYLRSFHYFFFDFFLF